MFKTTKNGITFNVASNGVSQQSEVFLNDRYLGSVSFGSNHDKELASFIEELSQRNYNFE